MASLPDKHIRLAIHTAVNNTDVNGTTFPCYTEQTGTNSGNAYYLLSTQLNTPEFTKCGQGWINDTEIQVIVRRPKNEGSKVLIDDAVDALITELRTLTLAGASGLRINRRQIDVTNEFSTEGATNIVYRKIVRFQTHIT